MRRSIAAALRAGKRVVIVGLCALLGIAPGAASAGTLTFQIIPATFSPAIAQIRAETPPVDAAPRITTEMLEAYIERQHQLKTFNGFAVAQPGKLTESMLLGYIARQHNGALDAIADVDLTPVPTLTPDMVSDYAQDGYVPTMKRVKHSDAEELCLAQAIYHEARGESPDGQMAVANIIINRALSKKYPSTICGVVFQNAENGRYRCQFTFACDGRSDMGTDRAAWNRSAKLADICFREFQRGKRPGVIPSNALFYHTTSVAPKWSHTFHRVAAIGAHIFYAVN